jgi:hypothetical protein
MAGTSLRCGGFIETEVYEQSKKLLMDSLGLTDRDIDDRLDGLLWALERDSSELAAPLPDTNLWVAVTDGEPPQIRVFLRPREDHPDEAELIWIEERSL